MAKTCPVCGGSYADSNAFCPTDGTTLLSDSASGDLVGSVIANRYLVSALLGEGGMGRVYLARHVRLPQQAAIKVMHAGMAKDQDAVARFNREAANAARIEHERVARVFDFGETAEGMVYLAMEYVPGRTLRSLLEDEKRLSPTRAAGIAYQVAEGLDAAHRIGIVHRDLKPDNILIVTDDQGVDRCKVVDFGIAKAADTTGTQLTRTGMIVGTPEFMSPEQVVGEPLDARSDVYALALVAFQMLAGVLPFTGATPERALMSRLMEDPQTLAAAAPDVNWPEAVQAVLTRALDREVATRTASALDFADALVAAVEGWLGAPVLRGRTPMSTAAVSATPPTGAVAIAEPPRPPVGAGTGASITAAANAATTAAPAVERAASVPAAAASRPSRLPLLIGGVALVAAAAWAAFGRGDGASPAQPAASPTASPEGVAPPVPAPPAAAREASAAPARDDAAAKGGGPAAPTTPNDIASGRPRADSVVPPTAAPPVLAGKGVPIGGAAAPASAAAAVAARRGVDSVRRVLEDDNSGEGEAKAAIPHLQRLLRDLGSASDSTWAYLALVSAYGLSGDPHRACAPLRSARRLATTDAQLRAVTNFFNSEALACVP
ncbi:MAG TPA: serine/threonine-protein kinase [Gemmatimonadaceae bacterium]|jgi:predicted Ser/Thr protein kinase|nr:serine/threonine protein kinase [Gemmatimonadota bacterium]MBK9408240.1 serine/threonine protein kinase [Gemmatimonadota bacterium]HPV73642.1 serine/threonine-protein kinase [Gemmatimonadaceae bacterium]